MKRLHLPAFLLSMVTIGVGCQHKEAPAAGKRGARQPSFPVEVLRIDEQPQDLLITAPGVVDAFEHVQVTARVAGVVDKVSFTEGQDVKRGQVLALIDSRRYALNVSSARSAVTKAEATAADNEQGLKRRQSASANNPGLIPGEEIETYQTKFRTAQADVEQAREAVKLAQLNLDDSNVKAPTEGVIQTRSVETGQYVQAGAVLATLLRRDPLLLRFTVTTAEAPRMKVGTAVEFTVKESQQTYGAKITLIAGAADAESRLVPVTAEVVSDKKFWLRPGSFAQVSIHLTPQRQFPMIPQAAARPSDRGFLAYVIENDTARERTLQLGLHTIDGRVEVKDGLHAGEQLVVRGVEALAEGTKVRVVPPSGSASAAASAPGAPPSAASGKASRRGGGRPRPDGSAPPPAEATP